MKFCRCNRRRNADLSFLQTLYYVCLLSPSISFSSSILQMIVKQAGVMIEAHESIQQLGRLYFAYVHQSVNVTASSSGAVLHIIRILLTFPMTYILQAGIALPTLVIPHHLNCYHVLTSYFSFSSSSAPDIRG